MGILKEFGIVIASDVDEVLVNSAKKHHRILIEEGKKRDWSNVPSYEEMLALGGTHQAFAQYPGYWELNEAMRNNPDFNRGLELIPGALEVSNFLGSILFIYLTTREEHLARVTHEELVNNGFPDVPVICRPKGIPLKDTSSWKLDVLRGVAEATGKKVNMIDDSISLHGVIKAAEDPRLGTILFAGPITPRGNGEKTWPQIKQMLKGEK